MIKMPGHLQIWSYHSPDYEECREIFSQGMQQLISITTCLIFSNLFWYITMVTIFAVMASFKWSILPLVACLFLSLILWALLYVVIYLQIWKIINYCLKTDLLDIEKTYMSNKGCHMWVAEWNGKIVGMVGLIQNEDHKPGIAELQRMSVSKTCRKMGVASKLLEELLKHSRQQGLEKIVLKTSNAQGPAVRLYRKFGFKLIEGKPCIPNFIFKSLIIMSFELELW